MSNICLYLDEDVESKKLLQALRNQGADVTFVARNRDTAHVLAIASVF